MNSKSPLTPEPILRELLRQIGRNRPAVDALHLLLMAVSPDLCGMLPPPAPANQAGIVVPFPVRAS